MKKQPTDNRLRTAKLKDGVGDVQCNHCEAVLPIGTAICTACKAFLDKRALNIKSSLACLRALTPADIHPSYVAGLNDPVVNRFLVNVRQSPQTIEAVTSYIDQNLQDPNAVLFGIWVNGDVQHCGTIRLHDIQRKAGSAHIGVCIFDRTRWGMRLGSATIKVVTEWARDVIGLDVIEAGFYAANRASEKAFMAAGYEWQEDILATFEKDSPPVTARIYRFVARGLHHGPSRSSGV